MQLHGFTSRFKLNHTMIFLEYAILMQSTNFSIIWCKIISHLNVVIILSFSYIYTMGKLHVLF